jgi:hypothetical protein
MVEMGTPQNTQNLMNSTSMNADSSIPSTGSLDEEEEESSPVKIKKKEEIHGGGGGGRKVMKMKELLREKNFLKYFLSFLNFKKINT